MRGVLIKQIARRRKQWLASMDALLLSIHKEELLNKADPSAQVTSSLKADRLALRNLLIQNWDHKTHIIRANLYHSGNRKGAHLVRQPKAQYLKRKIYRLEDLSSCGSIEHPQDIANAFST